MYAEKGIEKKDIVPNKTVIREISSKEALQDIIERIPYIQTIQAPNSRIRKELYQMAMDQYDDLEWVKVIKSVYLRMQDKHYEEYEPAFMSKAKEFLYTEIAISFEIPLNQVENFIIQEVEKQLEEF
ncbi:MAG: hypothetical protein PHX08_06010 [Lachnospiraceae bacterium]|nr:hypothetical protein [Lachnospiraceae bacterium]